MLKQDIPHAWVTVEPSSPTQDITIQAEHVVLHQQSTAAYIIIMEYHEHIAQAQRQESF